MRTAAALALAAPTLALAALSAADSASSTISSTTTTATPTTTSTTSSTIRGSDLPVTYRVNDELLTAAAIAGIARRHNPDSA